MNLLVPDAGSSVTLANQGMSCQCETVQAVSKVVECQSATDNAAGTNTKVTSLADAALVADTESAAA